MRTKAACVLFCAVVAFCSPVHSQHSHWEVGLNGSYAVSNDFDMMEYACGAASVDAAWVCRKRGDEFWRLYRHYPSFGLRASFAYSPQALYGHRIGVVGFVRTPLCRWLDYSIGLGLSTYTRAQCFTGDPENVFISSAVSCLIDIGLNLHLCDHLLFNASILHSSNGMLYKPNQGVNFLQLGVAAQLGNDYERSIDWQHSRSLIESVPSFPEREWSVALSAGAVLPRDTAVEERYYPCYDLSFYFQRYLNPVVAFGGAVDLWYNGSHRPLVQRRMNSYKLPIYLSSMATAELFWGPFSLKAGLGLVVVASSYVATPFYERLGAYWNFGRCFAGLALNARAGRVEFIEWTYGVRFR